MSEAIQQWVEKWAGKWARNMAREMANEKVREMAKKMLESGKMTINEIVAYLDLPVAEVEKLAGEDSIKMNEHESKNMRITIYDDEHIMKNHDADLTRTVTERVTKQSNIMSIKKLMYKLHFTEEEAMDALDIPEEERNRYKKMLEKE